MRDLYKVMGIPRIASADAIKRRYRTLVKELHPDRNPGDTIVEQKFKEVQAAYAILGDPQKRSRYDRGEIDADGRETFASAFQQGARQSHRESRREGRGSFFDDLFGRGGFKTRGADVSYDLDVAFEEAATGARKRLTLSDGTAVEVTVPAGIGDGETLRLRGKGTQGMGGGAPGDALVQVRVADHPLFRRDGSHLHLDLPVTLHEAVLGASVAVPTLEGRVNLRVPPHSNGGRVLRLKGKGLPDGKGGRGDLYVTLSLVLADPADPKLVGFLEAWEPKDAPDPREKAGLG